MSRLCVFLTAVAVSSAAWAQGGQQSLQSASTILGESVKVDASIGMLHGVVKEYVFNNVTGATISRLDWRYSNTLMLNAGVSARPFDWLLTGVRASTNVSRASHMNNFDWNVFGCPPAPGGGTFCASNSPGTEAARIFMGDAYIGVPYTFANGFEITPLVGYKYDLNSFRAYDGGANYLPPGMTFSGLGISYKQTWGAPYVGLQASGAYGRFGFEGRVIYSPFARGLGRDNHHYRSILFRDVYGDGGYLFMAHAGVSYALNSVFRATFAYDFQRWGQATGRTIIFDQVMQAAALIPGRASGGSQLSHMISVGLRADIGAVRKAEGALRDDPPPVWSGFYAGALAGFQGGRMNWKTWALNGLAPVFLATEVRDRAANGVSFGLFGGYNIQRGGLVGGVEIEGATSSVEVMGQGIPGTVNPPIFNAASDSVTHRINGDLSARARLGYLVTPQMLVYGTAGLAIGNMTTFVSCPAIGVSWCFFPERERARVWNPGWTAGFGAEWAISRNWFVRAEYRHSNFGTDWREYFAASAADSVVAKTSLKTNHANVGLGYRF